ncbi:Cytochrome P450 94A2 [Hibiscus syriacus]|uniref:Cytochrome P450 94A2 n=1 Tax=Hibiscus syriacus TaxID=106335 RepID=A0A6A2Z370_HIBSY|nr:Cytochrome P450 94A2 [Hibiscus syriacus]
MLIQLFTSFFLLTLPFVILKLITKTSKPKESAPPAHSISPKYYPIIGSSLALKSHEEDRVQWTTLILQNSPSATFTFHLLFGGRHIFTANPANVQHILKTQFSNYQKGPSSYSVLFDFLGNGIFNVDGESWKFQRQVSSHEFNTKSLRKFIQNVVDTELNGCLIPMFSDAAVDKNALDLQEILQRFAFDNVCKIAFGFDPACLSPSLPSAEFAEAFEEATKISSIRFRALFSISWKIMRFFDVGSEKRLKIAVSRVREFAMKINFATDIVISFILAGRDTTSVALTWFFWLLSKNPEVEEEILKEIKGKSGMPVFEEVKDMVYTHACLCETMRLYPPVPVDGKTAENDDVLPDGTVVKKGTIVTYHPYAMGRMEMLWGSDWEVFKPERWLQRDEGGKWSFVGERSLYLSSVPGGTQSLFGKGDGISADEKGGGWSSTTVQGCAGGGGWV